MEVRIGTSVAPTLHLAVVLLLKLIIIKIGWTITIGIVKIVVDFWQKVRPMNTAYRIIELCAIFDRDKAFAEELELC